MLREITEYGHKIKEEVKAKQSEIKIFREPIVKGKKPGFKSTIWNKRKKNQHEKRRELSTKKFP